MRRRYVIAVAAFAAISLLLVPRILRRDGDPLPAVTPHDFTGRLVAADLAPDWRVERFAVAFADDRVGPAQFTLAGGRRLEVPAGTPGGNACRLLLRREDIVKATGHTHRDRFEDLGREASPVCLVVGGLAADGRTVTWFHLLRDVTGDRGSVGTVAGRDATGRLVTRSGLAFPVAADPVLDSCPVTDPDRLRFAAYPVDAYVDVQSGRVARLVCLGRA